MEQDRERAAELQDLFEGLFRTIQNIAVRLTNLEGRVDSLEAANRSQIAREAQAALQEETEREARDLANLIFPRHKD